MRRACSRYGCGWLASCIVDESPSGCAVTAPPWPAAPGGICRCGGGSRTIIRSAPLLAYLRELQRRHAIAVIVIHHAKKGAGHVRAGQALRGSSEFHAWGDSNLYLRRNRDPGENGDITLTVEHRAAPAMPGVTLELAQRANALALEVIEPPTPQTPAPGSLDERITAALADVNRPLPFTELRARCRVRTATLYESLAALTAAGRLAKSDQGYHLAGR